MTAPETTLDRLRTATGTATGAGHDLLVIAYDSTLYDEYLDAGELLLNIGRSTENVEHRGDWAPAVHTASAGGSS